MPKEIIPTDRGTTADEVPDFSWKDNMKTPTTSKNHVKFDNNSTSSVVDDGLSDYNKVIDSGTGFINVSTDNGTFELTGGSIAWRNNNPGNLKYGEFGKAHGAIGSDWKNHCVFPNYKTGEKAQRELMFNKDSRYYSMSLLEAMKRYAPSDDNNHPTEYANYISRQAGLKKTDVINTFSKDEQDRMVKAMFAMEGYSVGHIKKVK